MLKLFKMFSTFFFVILYLQLTIQFHETSGSWVISCKPCIEVLNSCNFCKSKGDCLDCVMNIDTSCFNCFNDIFSYGQSTFNCDSAITYQKLACNYYCKPKLAGECNKVNGKCTC